jgi:hypothetical protein
VTSAAEMVRHDGSGNELGRQLFFTPLDRVDACWTDGSGVVVYGTPAQPATPAEPWRRCSGPGVVSRLTRLQGARVDLAVDHELTDAPVGRLQAETSHLHAQVGAAAGQPLCQPDRLDQHDRHDHQGDRAVAVRSA